MVCIQCYLPPILFMLYMKFIQPIVAPFIQPTIEKVVAYIWGPQAVQSGCPIRPSNKSGASKKTEATGDSPSSSTTTTAQTGEKAKGAKED